MLLGLYSSAADEVRVAAFLALRKLAVASDHSLRELVIKVRLFLALTLADLIHSRRESTRPSSPPAAPPLSTPSPPSPS